MDIVCFSHLHWNFVYQRPQHLLSRFAKTNRVFYFEEPHYHTGPGGDRLEISGDDVTVIKPFLKKRRRAFDYLSVQKKLLDGFIQEHGIENFVLWYYTPMALPVTEHLNPSVIVYDCMDELSAFKFAPPALKAMEKSLLEKADIVFTGGHSLYQAKKRFHANIHAMPSSIDKKHFSKARKQIEDPSDQKEIPHPRLGFYGVVDERFDSTLIKQVARKRKDWHFVIIGPVVKINPETLPKAPNIHYLGGKSYEELPAYLGGWDIALIPFKLNKSTKFISPTKTPEYLAGGKPVLSTPIRDVVNPYGMRGLVCIVENHQDFIDKAEKELARKNSARWLSKVDSYLERDSWDAVWAKMKALVEKEYRRSRREQKKEIRNV